MSTEVEDTSKTPTPQGNVTVIAATDIPTHSVAGPYPKEVHIGYHATDTPTAALASQVIFKDGKIVQPKDTFHQWLLDVNPARDRHEQNAETYRDVKGGLYLRVIRAVNEGEQLLVWYSDALARESEIPILTPANIRGNQRYQCTDCDKVFQYPNCLKSHIRFWCTNGRTDSRNDSEKASLFNVRSMLNLPETGDVPRRAALPSVSAFLNTKSKAHTYKDTIHNWLLMQTSNQTLTTSESSAFKPHQKTANRPRVGPEASCQTGSAEQGVLNLSVREPISGSVPPTSLSGLTQPIQIFNHIHPPALPIAIDHAALTLYYPYLNQVNQQPRHCCGPLPAHNALIQQREACVPQYGNHLLMTASNPGVSGNPQCYQAQMADPLQRKSSPPGGVSFPFPMPSESEGEPLDLIPRSLFTSKSRKGHLCIYCGKLYSRKYGLKIHLRTHTGYKPLKCKVCLRPFGDPSNLNKHVRLHAEGDTPYRCDYCGKVLVRRRDLERHIRSRHPEAESTVKEPSDDEVDQADTTTEDASHETDIVVT